MPSILLYEYTCSSGKRSDKGLSQSLAAEGRAMLVALAADFDSTSHYTHVLWDNRLGIFPSAAARIVSNDDSADEQALLAHCAHIVDWTIIIAPETDGVLAERCRWVESAGGRLLGCSAALVELLSDKHRTVEHLAANDVPVPRGQTWDPGELPPSLPCPVVVKPRDGAGSQLTFLVEDIPALHELLAGYEVSARIEKFIPSTPCSLSFLCGPRGCLPLVPCCQRIGFEQYTDHSPQESARLRKIEYLGGRHPLPAHLTQRAIDLARRAVKTLPEPIGYLGVDLILGDSDDGSRDFVIEINPRLTTSYVGLRSASRLNLAQAMLDVADGRHPSLSFNNEAIEFDSDGTVRRMSQAANSVATEP